MGGVWGRPASRASIQHFLGAVQAHGIVHFVRGRAAWGSTYGIDTYPSACCCADGPDVLNGRISHAVFPGVVLGDDVLSTSRGIMPRRLGSTLGQLGHGGCHTHHRNQYKELHGVLCSLWLS